MIAMLDENLALSCLFVHAGCFRVMRAVHSLYNVVVFKADLLAAICHYARHGVRTAVLIWTF